VDVDDVDDVDDEDVDDEDDRSTGRSSPPPSRAEEMPANPPMPTNPRSGTRRSLRVRAVVVMAASSGAHPQPGLSAR